jgi:hypothetical protein
MRVQRRLWIHSRSGSLTLPPMTASLFVEMRWRIWESIDIVAELKGPRFTLRFKWGCKWYEWQGLQHRHLQCQSEVERILPSSHQPSIQVQYSILDVKCWHAMIAEEVMLKVQSQAQMVNMLWWTKLSFKGKLGFSQLIYLVLAIVSTLLLEQTIILLSLTPSGEATRVAKPWRDWQRLLYVKVTLLCRKTLR